jgi:hypothetical protein
MGERALGLPNTSNQFVVDNLMKGYILTAGGPFPHFACHTQSVTPTACLTSRAENLAEKKIRDSSLNFRQWYVTS